MRKHLLRGGSLVAALLLWQLLTSLHVNFWLHFDRLPTVVDVARDLGYQLQTPMYYQDLGDSLARILMGFTLAALAGVAIGVAVGRSALTGSRCGLTSRRSTARMPLRLTSASAKPRQPWNSCGPTGSS